MIELNLVQEKIANYTADGFAAMKETIDAFNADKVKLQERKTDIIANDMKIRQTIEDLNTHICESFQQIFTIFCNNFVKTFKRFAARGRANLILKSANDTNNIDEFTGVDIRVSFSNTTEPVDVCQLSDEQKSVVALAFILAIQKSSPSPFYLFDCIERVRIYLQKEEFQDFFV